MGNKGDKENKGNIYRNMDNVYYNSNSRNNKVFYSNRGRVLDNTFDSPV